MKPDWDKLAETYAGSPNVLIGDVDCTATGNDELCKTYGVTGYPTIKYFTKETGRDGKKYEKGRTLDNLKTFVKKTLKGKKRICDVASKEGCTEEELRILSTFVGQSMADLDSKSAELSKKLDGVLKSDVRKKASDEARVLSMWRKHMQKKPEGEL